MRQSIRVFIVLISVCLLHGHAQDIPSIKLEKSVEIVNQNTFAVESVAISDDGSRLCWVGKSKDSKLVMPSEIFIKREEQDEVIKADKGWILNAFTKCSFDNHNNLVTSKLHWRPLALSRTLLSGIITGDLDPVGYVTSITTYDMEQKNKQQSILPKDMGFNSNGVFLKHPRVSPNGEWLTFYLYSEKLQGIYIYHLASGRVHQLGTEYDKHPTWTTDGKKILFHYQINAKDKIPERAYLGYYDLQLKHNGELDSSKRILLDDPAKLSFSYQKHPAQVTGTDYVIFHGEKTPGAKKALFVRKLEPDSPTIELKLQLLDGTKITRGKHPATGALTSDIVFIGKTKGTDQDMVLKLTPSASVDLQRQLLQLKQSN